MIALLFATALAAAQPVEPAPGDPGREATEHLTRPEPRIMGPAEGEEAAALIAAFAETLRGEPGVAQAFLVVVDYGPPDGRRRVLVLDGPKNEALSERLLDQFAVSVFSNETLDVVFLKAAQVRRVAEKAAPFYRRAG